jgi:hypothetical protein
VIFVQLVIPLVESLARASRTPLQRSGQTGLHGISTDFRPADTLSNHMKVVDRMEPSGSCAEILENQQVKDVFEYSTLASPVGYNPPSLSA